LTLRLSSPWTVPSLQTGMISNTELSRRATNILVEVSKRFLRKMSSVKKTRFQAKCLEAETHQWIITR
jgi:hypothetical protein